jgi:hypothetical protein
VVIAGVRGQAQRADGLEGATHAREQHAAGSEHERRRPEDHNLHATSAVWT